MGPDWKPSFEGCGIQVSNHTTSYDIVASFHLGTTSFVSKAEVRKIFIIGKIAEICECLFTDRGATKEQREETLRRIGDHQMAAEKGELPFLHVFPEGATTNGTKLLQFKKGAFYNLRTVRPMVYKWWAPLGSPATDCVSFYHF